jgi:uncharacterized protein YihD (DUF1040 family)
MREIERIERILELIKKNWKDYPDLRFGQLLINMKVVADTIPMWNLEDDDLEEHLNKFNWNEYKIEE